MKKTKRQAKPSFSFLLNLLTRDGTIIFLITALTHFINLFGFPPIEGDEGVYVGQGWWLVNFFKITPYAYWYDHFPLGWLQIGLWQKLTGGPFTFGLAAFSGRVFTVILVCLTNVFLYKLIKKISKSENFAFISSLFFAFSPLAILYHRRVLLDNIAIFWLIISIYSLISANGRLLRFFFSALFLGIAFLSKESMIFFLPAFLIAVFYLARKENYSLSLFVFFLTSFAVFSLFPLLAILKGELFPSSWFSSPPHNSLIDALLYQAGRGSNLSFWQEGSDFRLNLGTWLQQDLLFMGLGLWSLLFSVIFGSPLVRLVALFGLSYFLFLIRGGVVLNFYVIPIIPFLAANFGLALWTISLRVKALGKILEEHFLFLSLVIVSLGLLFSGNLFTTDATKNQREVVNYIKHEFDPNSVIITDFTPWVDLRLARFSKDIEFENSEWFYKVELDPTVRKNLGNNPFDIDYIVLTDEMVSQLKTGQFPFLKLALDNSVFIKDYPPLINYATTPRDIKNLISADNSWVSIYRVDKEKYQSAFGTLLAP